jgi:hypothetical protein
MTYVDTFVDVSVAYNEMKLGMSGTFQELNFWRMIGT